MTHSKRPVIGLGGRRRHRHDLLDAPPALADTRIDLYMTDYASGVFEAGGLPIHLPFDTDVEQVIDLVDGLLLPGGADVDPALYGADPHPELEPTESLRDTLEAELIDAAADADLPLLGICRGIQILNVHAGGTLNQHIPDHARFDSDVGTAVHTVEFTAGSVAEQLYGPTLKVNSLHHQTVAEVAPGFTATGIADDGAVEAIESTTHRWLGVQWHPELMPTRPDDPIFSWLVEQARK